MSENLDLFGNPITAPTPIVQSAKDKDDALQVVWRPYKGSSVPCQECTTQYMLGRRSGVTSAKWVRREGEHELYLCYPHKAERLDRENRGIG